MLEATRPNELMITTRWPTSRPTGCARSNWSRSPAPCAEPPGATGMRARDASGWRDAHGCSPGVPPVVLATAACTSLVERRAPRPDARAPRPSHPTHAPQRRRHSAAPSTRSSTSAPAPTAHPGAPTGLAQQALAGMTERAAGRAAADGRLPELRRHVRAPSRRSALPRGLGDPRRQQHARASRGRARSPRSCRHHAPARAEAVRSTDQEGGLVQRMRGPGFSTSPAPWCRARCRRPMLQARRAGWGSSCSGRRSTSTSRRCSTPCRRRRRATRRSATSTASTATTRRRGDARRSRSPQGLGRRRASTPTVKHFPGLGRVTGNTDTTQRRHRHRDDAPRSVPAARSRRRSGSTSRS